MTDHGYYKATNPAAKAVAVLTDKLCSARRWKRCRHCGAKAAVYADPTLGHRDCIECGAEPKGIKGASAAAAAAGEAKP